MDLTRLFRSESLDSTSTSTSTAPTSPTASPNPSSGPHARLRVDTSVPNLAVARKAASFRVDRTNAAHNFWNAAPPTPAPTPTASEPSPGPSPAPTPTHDVATPLAAAHHDAGPQRSIQRRRSHSECLLLAKNGVTDLPGPCQEYISSVKQILARSERSRGGGMRSSPVAH